jgi:Helix-turn-helix domain
MVYIDTMRKTLHTLIIKDAVYDSAQSIVKRLGICPETLTRWRKKGKIAGALRIAGRLYYPRVELDKCLMSTA